MAKVLYITAHPHDETVSYSMATAKAFIESYKEANPSDEVVHIDLYKENIPHIDADVFAGWASCNQVLASIHFQLKSKRKLLA